MPDICLAGTGGMLPLKNRYLTSLYCEHNGKALLIDCGEGTQVALKDHGLKLSRIGTILITHCHADHIAGLPGLLLSVGNCSRTNPIDIVMPESAVPVIRNLLSICGGLPYDIFLFSLSEKKISSFSGGKIDPMLEISAIPLKHRIPCMGYSLLFKKRPEFLPEKARSLGIPVNLWKQLHSGKSAEFGGRLVYPSEVTGEPRPPIKITYVTDTLPFDGIAEFARGSDLLIHEGMYGDLSKRDSMNEKKHSLMQDACAAAVDSGSKRLWLTHYSPAEKDPSVYDEDMKKIFPGTVISRDGEKISL